mmetsp:Transcript_26559/g.82086  ORF Transcript_26559/g.82086 Transcript_26559/m.82086 type:complete len:393 (-) Transcript_26559:850-2028(-)
MNRSLTEQLDEIPCCHYLPTLHLPRIGIAHEGIQLGQRLHLQRYQVLEVVVFRGVTALGWSRRCCEEQSAHFRIFKRRSCYVFEIGRSIRWRSLSLRTRVGNGEAISVYLEIIKVGGVGDIARVAWPRLRYRRRARWVTIRRTFAGLDETKNLTRSCAAHSVGRRRRDRARRDGSLLGNRNRRTSDGVCTERGGDAGCCPSAPKTGTLIQSKRWNYGRRRPNHRREHGGALGPAAASRRDRLFVVDEHVKTLNNAERRTHRLHVISRGRFQLGTRHAEQHCVVRVVGVPRPKQRACFVIIADCDSKIRERHPRAGVIGLKIKNTLERVARSRNVTEPRLRLGGSVPHTGDTHGFVPEHGARQIERFLEPSDTQHHFAGIEQPIPKFVNRFST